MEREDGGKGSRAGPFAEQEKPPVSGMSHRAVLCLVAQPNALAEGLCVVSYSLRSLEFHRIQAGF